MGHATMGLELQDPERRIPGKRRRAYTVSQGACVVQLHCAPATACRMSDQQAANSHLNQLHMPRTACKVKNLECH